MFTGALSQELRKTVWLMNNHGEESVSGRRCVMQGMMGGERAVDLSEPDLSLSLSQDVLLV